MLINCVAYQDGQRLGDIRVPEIRNALMRPNAFVWVALKDPEPEELVAMQEEFDLHELAIEDARHGQQRPKIEEYGESLFAAVRLVDWNGNGLRHGELAIFVGPNYVLSVRRNSDQSFTEVRRRCEREPELLRYGASFVFYALLDAVVDRYFPVIAGFETELGAIEEQIFIKTAARSNIQRLYELKRDLMNFKQAVEPLMQALGRLHGGRVPHILAAMQEYFRDVDDHLERINTAADRIHDTIGTAIQVTLSMVTIEQSEINKKLAAWAGIFGVATAFAGIWGMNFQHMPELGWLYGYPAALGIITTACGILYLRFKRTGWL